MAIADEKLSSFFSKQRVGAFSALAKSGKPNTCVKNIEQHKDPGSDNDKRSNKSSSHEEPEATTVSNPLVGQAIANNAEEHFNGLSLQEKPKPTTVSDPLANKVTAKSDKKKLSITSSQEKTKTPTISNPLAQQSQSVSTKPSKQKQSVSKALAKPLADESLVYSRHLHKFSKKEQELIFYIFAKCAQERALTSPIISSEELMDVLLVKPERLRNLIFRISKKGGVSCEVFKSGPSACRFFHIDERFYEELLRLQQSNSALANPLAKPTSSSSSFLKNKTTTNEIPEEWKKIETKHLQYALNNMKDGVGQIFNLSQIKAIYATQILTADEVQRSINNFTYGIENLANQAPYKSMKKPAGFLVDSLKNGDVWDEPRYLSPQQQAVKKIYQNLVDDLSANKRSLFEEWLGEETEKKRERLRENLPSNQFFGENEFREEAWKEFNTMEWRKILKEKSIKVLGSENEELIDNIMSAD